MNGQQRKTTWAMLTVIASGGREPLLWSSNNSSPHRFTISILFSLALGLVAGLLIWGVDRSLQIWKKSSPRRTK